MLKNKKPSVDLGLSSKGYYKSIGVLVGSDVMYVHLKWEKGEEQYPNYHNDRLVLLNQ